MCGNFGIIFLDPRFRDKVLPLPAPPVVKAQPLIDPDTLGKRSTNAACAIVYASILLHYVRAEAPTVCRVRA